MKNYKLNLKENEEMMFDVDEMMEQELVKFKDSIKGIKEFNRFNIWTKVYKMLNYDIIDDLKVEEVYKFNDTAAVIKLSFRGKVEYDFLNLNPKSMTVGCMNVRDDKVRPYVVRRLLVPQTVEEALMYAKSPLPEEGIKTIKETLDELTKNGSKYVFKPKQEAKKEGVKQQPKQEAKKEETKQQPKQEESVRVYNPRHNAPQPNYKCAVGRVEKIIPDKPKTKTTKCGWQADGSYKFY